MNRSGPGGALRVVVCSAIFCGCQHAPPARKLIDDAAQALGGKDKVVAVKRLTIEGRGTDTNLGQNVTPEGELPVWKVTDFQETIDPGAGRMHMREIREAQFLFAAATVQRQEQGLDSNVAYNVSVDGKATRASDAVARDRRIALLHHPLIIIRAALDPAAKVSNRRREGSQQLVDITTANSDLLTLAVESATGLPTRVTSLTDNPNLGDVPIETSFFDYEATGGLKLPKHLVTHVDRYPQFDLYVSRNLINGDATTLDAPEEAKAANPPAAPPIVVTAEPVAEGIWWLAGSGNHHSVLFEFSDHLALFEVPLNEARSKAVIDKARTVVPSKPLTQAIVSHHHFDHSGGLRVAVAEGLTIVTYRGNIPFFQELVARRHRLIPDELEKKPQPPHFLPVDDELTFKDKAMEVRLYHLLDNPREGTNLFAYVPRDHILVQADLYDSTWTQYPWADNVLRNLALRGLRVEKDVPVHGEIQSWAQVLKTMQLRGAGGER